MDLAFRAIQPPTQTRPPVTMRTNGGKSGRRPLVSNSATQSTSTASNARLIMLIVSDVVPPYAHGAYARTAKKIQRDAFRQRIGITVKFRKQRFYQPITRRSPAPIGLSVPCQKASCVMFLTRSWHPALVSNAGCSKDRILTFRRHLRR